VFPKFVLRMRKTAISEILVRILTFGLDPTKPILSSVYLCIKQLHKNMTADNTRTGPIRLAKRSQCPTHSIIWQSYDILKRFFTIQV